MKSRTMMAIAGAAALLIVAAVAGCSGGVSRELASDGFEADTDLWADLDEVAVSTEGAFAGEASLMAFATGQLRVPVMDVPIADIAGDSITVALRTRTEVMQRPVIFELILDREEGDPRLTQVVRREVHRTIPWTYVTASFPVLPDETPTRARVALVMRGAGKIWIDDMTLWDGAPAPEAGSE
jgi:hypothetical protein